MRIPPHARGKLLNPGLLAAAVLAWSVAPAAAIELGTSTRIMPGGPSSVDSAASGIAQSAVFAPPASAVAQAEYGRLRAAAHSFHDAETPLSRFAHAVATWEDFVVITAPGFSNVTFTFDVDLTGIATAFQPPEWGTNGNMSAAYELEISAAPEGGGIDRTGLFAFVVSNPDGSSSFVGDLLNQIHTLSISAPVGENVIFIGNLLASGSGGTAPDVDEGLGVSAMDLTNTVRWLGITGFFDEAGNPIDATIASASGTDWTQPFVAAVAVPEPGLIGLAALLLALGAGRAGTKRKLGRPRSMARPTLHS